MQERRIFQRFNIEVPIKFHTISLEKNIKGTGKIVNISAGGGGMVVTAKYLLPNTLLEMELLFPDNKDPFIATAKVIWLKAMEPTLFLAGVEFEKVDFMGMARALRLHV
ncbi:MAG: PilZ domain-containing protein [Candidatus Omnitrophota bacterium]|jgi:hypothetical protein